MKATILLLLLSLCSCDRDGAPSGKGSQTPAVPAQEDQGQAIDAAAPEAAARETRILFETKEGEPAVVVEVVQTPAKIQRGLMHRQHMAPDRGMLFVFASDRVRSFWMKNTLIPLDMLFVTSDLKVAGIVRDTEPLTLDSRSVGIPTRYVLEVNGGWTAAHSVETGTQLRIENLPPIAKPPL